MSNAALLGGLFIGVLSALPIVSIGNCCCLWIGGGGILAAYLAQQGTARALPLGQGALVGLLAGIVGAGVWLVASATVDLVIGPFQARLLDAVLDADLPPEVRDLFENARDSVGGPLRYLAGFVVQLTGGLVFSTLGGLVGAVYFRRTAAPELEGPAAP